MPQSLHHATGKIGGLYTYYRIEEYLIYKYESKWMQVKTYDELSEAEKGLEQYKNTRTTKLRIIKITEEIVSTT